MHKLTAATWLFVFSWIGIASGFELAQLERSIQKEPTYESGLAKYCLLVIGQKAKHRVWLAVDGNTLYLDRNGNGDLTDDIKTLAGRETGWVQLGDIGTDEGVYGRLRVSRSTDGTFKLRINTPNRGGQYVGFSKAIRPTLGDTLDDAPIIHLGGPMTLGQYGPVQEIPRDHEGVSYRVSSLKLMIGTAGVGAGTFAAYHCNCRRKSNNDSMLVGEFSFPSAANGGGQIESRATYDQKG